MKNNVKNAIFAILCISFLVLLFVGLTNSRISRSNYWNDYPNTVSNSSEIDEVKELCREGIDTQDEIVSDFIKVVFDGSTYNMYYYYENIKGYYRLKIDWSGAEKIFKGDTITPPTGVRKVKLSLYL